ncbi:MAG: helix-turn-helix transcriptional regulator [Cyclobacteriaceae bacterium]
MHRVRDEDVMKAFGANLKRIRLQQGMTQEELANKADIAFSSVARIEIGKINTTISTIARLAQTLKVSQKELMDF